MKSKFILCGLVKGSDKVSDFRLVHNARRYCLGTCVRVNIPDDLTLCTYPRDGYSTTPDNRTLDELGWDCYVVFKGVWRRFNWLKQLNQCEWSDALKYIFNLDCCFDDICFTDDHEYYKTWYKDRMSGTKEFLAKNDIIYPAFNNNTIKDLNIQPSLRDYLWNDTNTYEWYKIYQGLKNKK